MNWQYFWKTNLVCPQCKNKIIINKTLIICEKCQKNYSIINGVPCFINKKLTDHQKSELEFHLTQKHILSYIKNYYNQIDSKYKWVLKWINSKTIKKSTKIICIGGSYKDDLPHVKSDFKFNIDHLAHEYVKIFPEIINANAKHIASKSENVPFEDEYADIIYSRNSLDHVNNPIKTLLEIYRVLKKNGRFFLSVYYNSFFVNSHETTIIDNDFIENHIKNLFEIEWIKISSSQSEGLSQPPKITQPGKKKLGWLYVVLKKKENYNDYDIEELENYEKLTSYFHSAIFYDERKNYNEASKFFAKIISLKPFLKSDEMRLLYSKIRYYSITDHDALKRFLNKFKLTYKEPFWWMIIIDSSWPLFKKEIKKQIKDLEIIKNEKLFLKKYIKVKKHLPSSIFVYDDLVLKNLFNFKSIQIKSIFNRIISLLPIQAKNLYYNLYIKLHLNLLLKK